MLAHVYTVNPREPEGGRSGVQVSLRLTMPGMVALIFNPSTWEAEAGGSL